MKPLLALCALVAFTAFFQPGPICRAATNDNVDSNASLPATDASNKPYLLRTGDEVDITVAGHDELRTSLVVLPDGSVTVPGAGSIQAAGMTVSQLTAALVKGFGQTINQPDVTVSIHPSDKSISKISILGGVKAPGQYAIADDAHVLDVIAEAGGLTADPSLSTGTLIRAGGLETVPIDFSNLFGSPTSYQNIAVKSGDVLLIESREAFQIQLAGEVAKPGPYDVAKNGAPIFDLLLQAGGTTPSASLKSAQIMHDGKMQIVDLSGMGSNLSGPANTTRLMPGDVLLIPKIIDRYAILGEVRDPGAYDIPDGHSMSLKSALIVAGGTVDDADLKNASLLRTDVAGKTTAVPINVASLLTGKSADVPLQAGDIVYVPVEHPSAPFNPLSLVSLVPLVGLFK